MKKVISIDQSGKGTTGLFLVENHGSSEPIKYSFEEFKSESWEEHLDFLIEQILEHKPDIILFENTTFLYSRQHQGTINLYKLTGGVVAIEKMLKFINKRTDVNLNYSPEIGYITVNSVKAFRDKIQDGTKNIEGLDYKVGRGKGWKFNDFRISLHLVDALVVYHLWTKKHFPTKKDTESEITELQVKGNRKGNTQKARLDYLKEIWRNYYE